MTNIIAVANQKGGIGKSTTTLNLGAFLAKQGKKVLFVDLDPQGNLSYVLGYPEDNELFATDLFTKKKTAEEVLLPVERGMGIASHPLLAATDIEDASALKTALESVKDRFDYVLVDTPPTLGMLTLNALTAANLILVPVQASIFSLQGLGQLYDTIQAVRQFSNPNLKIAGILITQYKQQANLSKKLREMVNETAQAMGTETFQTPIRYTVQLEEANAFRQDIFSYRPKSNGSADYESFGKELLERIERAN